MKKLNLKDKIQILLNNFKDLPTDRKLGIAMLFIAGLMFVGGTLYIIGSSVINIDKKNNIAQSQDFINTLNQLSNDMDTNLKIYGFESLNKDTEAIDAHFDNYNQLLDTTNKKLQEYSNTKNENTNDIQEPVSAPLNPTPTPSLTPATIVYEEKYNILTDVVENQKDYLDLRDRGFSILENLSDSFQFEISQDITDLSTRLTSINNNLENIYSDDVNADLSEIHLELFDLNRDLISTNDSHRKKIKDELQNSYLLKHEKTIETLMQTIKENERKIPEKEYENIQENINSIQKIVADLKEKFSESLWAKLEDKSKNLQDTIEKIQNYMKTN